LSVLSPNSPDPFAACEETVRRHDPDRYFSALFAPEGKRRHLFALYALYYELAHAAQAAREPMLVEIRLMWWRETIESARAGKPRDHDVARALVETLAAADLPQAMFEPMIAARGYRTQPFADGAAAEAHGEATVGALMRLACRALGAEAEVRDAGIAYALAGQSGGLFHSIDTGMLARAHYDAARRTAIPRQALPAFLPATLVPLYLKRADPPLWRKQIALWRAAARGRL
jgi:Squalene/phytoene synthase